MHSPKRSEFDHRGGHLQILADLGLTEDRIREALVLGLRRHHARDDGLPGSFAGAIPTAYAKASLARALGAVGDETGEVKLQGWIDDDWRLKTAIEDGTEAFSVKVWLGDDDTGLENVEPGHPRPRGAKGAETKDEVGRNRAQIGLFDDLPEDERRRIFEFQSKDPPDGRVFAVILYRYKIKEQRCMLFSELSIPDGYDEEARTITGWAHRHVFPVVTVDLGPKSGDTYDDGDDFDPDLDRG